MNERKQINHILNFYKTLDLHEAISNASFGRNEKDEMDPHQYRIGKVICGIGADCLLKKQKEISKCKSFEDVFAITEQVRKQIYRLGNLWSYDAALRISANLGFEPKSVYIQAGVRAGMKKLRPDEKSFERILARESFSEDFADLKPYEIEYFLCIWGSKNINNINKIQ